jgi:predicted GNAT family acetyltransferase
MGEIITYNDSASRYEMTVDGLIVFANIRRQGDVLYIDYVYAPSELRGTGAAGRFMEGLMKLVRAENLKVVPICGYAATWLQRHSEYQDLLKS